MPFTPYPIAEVVTSRSPNPEVHSKDEGAHYSIRMIGLGDVGFRAAEGRKEQEHRLKVFGRHFEFELGEKMVAILRDSQRYRNVIPFPPPTPSEQEAA